MPNSSRPTSDQPRSEQNGAAPSGNVVASESQPQTENETLFRAIFENTGSGMALVDMQGRPVKCNPALQKLLGYTEEELLGMSFMEFTHPDDREWEWELYAELMAGARDKIEYEKRYITKDRQVIWVNLVATMVKDEEGTPKYAVGMIQDITERKQAEEDLRRVSERLQLATRAANIGIWDWDVARDETVWDDAMYSLYGIRKGDFSGAYDAWAKSLAPEDFERAQAELQAALRGEREFDSEFRVVWPDGSIHFIKAGSQTFHDEEGRPVRMVGVNYDITERRRAEEQNLKLIHDLGERVKELTALHHTARILQDEEKSVPELLQEIVSLLPPAWQYPEVTAARIILGGKEFKTPNFSRAQWSQVARFTSGNLEGAVEVVYLEERPEEDIGPFLSEERNLIDSLAEMISSTLNRRFTQDELRVSEERFTKAFKASPVPVVILSDRDRTFLEVNERWETTFGYTREDTIGRTALELKFFLTVEDRDRLRALGERQNFLRDEEVTVRTKQGEIRHVTMSVERFMNNEELYNICLFNDITERKRAEEALQESEAKLKNAQRIAKLGYWERDLLADRITLSEETRRIFGLSQRVFTHAEMQEMAHPDDRERQERALQDALQGKRRYDIEFRIVPANGEVRFIHVWDEIAYDERGRPIRMFGTVQDITERKRAEAALRESQQLLHLVLATLPVGVIVTDQAGDITLINAASKRIWGDVIVSGRQRWEQTEGFWHDSGERIAPTAWTSVRALSEGQTSLNDLIDIKTYDGRRKTIENSAAPIRDAEGLIVGAVIINEDVTERVRAEEALHRSEESFRKAFEASPAPGVIVRSQDRRYLNVNGAFVRTFGYTAEEAVGKTRAEMSLWLTGREREAFWQKLCEKNAIKGYETRARTKSGELIDVLLYAEAIELSGEQCFIFSMIDITERKHTEERLKASHEQLRALSERLRKAKEEEGIRIARELHDELGAALTSLKWSLMRLDKVYSGNGHPGVQPGAREEIDEMVRLVDTTINTVRRISSELRPSVLDDLGLIPAIEWHAQQFQEHTGIVCRFDSLIENCELNRGQATTVFRIFQEAMTNVLRHARATKVNIIIEEEEGEFVLEIKDNGRGITESERLGLHSLGLLGMRERAHSVGGKVEINGTAGKGTVLIIRLPVKGDTPP